jgi:hypothetical protein
MNMNKSPFTQLETEDESSVRFEASIELPRTTDHEEGHSVVLEIYQAKLSQGKPAQLSISHEVGGHHKDLGTISIPETVACDFTGYSNKTTPALIATAPELLKTCRVLLERAQQLSAGTKAIDGLIPDARMDLELDIEDASKLIDRIEGGAE